MTLKSTGIFRFPKKIETEVSYAQINKNENKLYKLTKYVDVNDYVFSEFMECLYQDCVPRRCKNCGNYFINRSGHVTEYCEEIAPGETKKTCREVGAKNSYEKKVKNNPVWQTYQRAYKTHYARMLKKKMTKEEFFVWGEYAVGLREKALAGELEFDDYVEQIKK